MPRASRSPASTPSFVSRIRPTGGSITRLTMHEDAPGRFRGNTAQAKGEWDVVIELSRGDERMFRSKNRISVH